MTSIGRRCKRGDALSRAILIAREAFPFFSAMWLCRAWAAWSLQAPVRSFAPRTFLFWDPVLRVFNFGGHRRWVIPVPIPNTEVKPPVADGTWPSGPGE